MLARLRIWGICRRARAAGVSPAEIDRVRASARDPWSVVAALILAFPHAA